MWGSVERWTRYTSYIYIYTNIYIRFHLDIDYILSSGLTRHAFLSWYGYFVCMSFDWYGYLKTVHIGSIFMYTFYLLNLCENVIPNINLHSFNTRDTEDDSEWVSEKNFLNSPNRTRSLFRSVSLYTPFGWSVVWSVACLFCITCWYFRFAVHIFSSFFFALIHVL